jgi:phenylacetate-coenzyme A ligase PaaK-like adenylate-forming protein
LFLGTLLKTVRLLAPGRHTPRSIEAHQNKALRRIIEDATSSVPRYAELYGSLFDEFDWSDDIQHNLSQIPVVTKALLKRSFPDLLLSQDYSKASLYPVATSGTTDRVMLFQDEGKRNCDRAADLVHALRDSYCRPLRKRLIIPPDACYERCGLDENARAFTVGSRINAALRAPSGSRRRAWRQVITQLMQDIVWRARYVSSLGVEGSAINQAVANDYFQQIFDFRPDSVSGLPYYLYILAIKHMRAGGPAVSVPVMRPSGGKATPYMIETIEREFGSRYRENYGTAELGTIAYDCEHDRAQHLIERFFIVEIVRDGKPVQDGQLGEILITDLVNRASPLIRYEVGDVGRIIPSPCACGFAGMRFEVKGRLDETVVFGDGSAFAGDDILDHIQRELGFSFAKLVQKGPYRFDLEIASESNEDILVDDAIITESLSDFFAQNVQVRCRKVRRTAPEPSGKYRFVVSNSHDGFHSSADQITLAS